MLKVFDIFFVSFHSLLIVFNLFGWIFPGARKWNLVTLLLTGLSWFGLGLIYGIGYCPLTDWHFNILEKLGHNDLPLSYMSYLVNRLLKLHTDPQLIDTLTMVLFVLALAASVIFNIRDRWRKAR